MGWIGIYPWMSVHGLDQNQAKVYPSAKPTTGVRYAASETGTSGMSWAWGRKQDTNPVLRTKSIGCITGASLQARGDLVGEGDSGGGFVSGRSCPTGRAMVAMCCDEVKVGLTGWRRTGGDAKRRRGILHGRESVGLWASI